MDDVGANDDDFDFLEGDDLGEFFGDDEIAGEAASILVKDGVRGDGQFQSVEPVTVTPIENVTELFPRAPAKLFPTVVGCVAQAQINVGVDLRKLCCGARNVEFVPKKNPSATMRLRDPACVCMIRNSGSIMVIGAVNPNAARQGAELCVRIIRKVLDLPTVTSLKFRVRSIMAKFDVAHPIRLDGLQREHSDMCAYEPETFCGCIVKLRGPESNPWAVTCNVFVTGKATMIGAKSREELAAAFYTILPILAKHAKI